jgi:hypothetical protein
MMERRPGSFLPYAPIDFLSAASIVVPHSLARTRLGFRPVALDRALDAVLD